MKSLFVGIFLLAILRPYFPTDAYVIHKSSSCSRSKSTTCLNGRCRTEENVSGNCDDSSGSSYSGGNHDLMAPDLSTHNDFGSHSSYGLSTSHNSYPSVSQNSYSSHTSSSYTPSNYGSHRSYTSYSSPSSGYHSNVHETSSRDFDRDVENFKKNYESSRRDFHESLKSFVRSLDDFSHDLHHNLGHAL